MDTLRPTVANYLWPGSRSKCCERPKASQAEVQIGK